MDDTSRLDEALAADDAPPCAELLADGLEEIRQLPSTHGLEEIIHLLEHMPRVATAARRQKALRLVEQLLASGEYGSIHAVAPRVAREIGVAASTVRGWACQAGVEARGWGSR